MRETNTRTFGYLLILSCVVGIGIGAWGMHTWQVSDLKTALALSQKDLEYIKRLPPVVVKEKGEVKTETQIAYVPKETIHYIDSKIGQQVTGTEKTDMNVNVGKTEFNLLLNGKEMKFTKADDEKVMFEKNKITMNQTSTARLEVDNTKEVEALVWARMEAERNHFSAGLYGTNKGIAASIGIMPSKHIEYNVITTVPDTSKFFGAGVKLFF